MIRDAIYAALFAKLTALSASFVTISRRLQHFDDVPSGAQPALFLTVGNHNVDVTTGRPSRWVMGAELYVYARTDGRQVAGSVLLPLLDVIANTLAPDDLVNYRLTLGGLVEYCRIEGDVQIFEGDLGDQAIMIIPLSMRANQ